MSDEHDRQDGAAPLEIEVEGLRKTFGRREVLKGISFGVPRGGFLSIFGPNGAGKTTTLRVLATLLTASGGTVKVAGHDVREDPMPVRKAIGFISHNAMLYPDLTAQENLRFYADMYGVEDREARITELLERLELSARRYDVVRTYSKGMRQRLAIARAILHRPRVLLLDEPHSGLDPRAVDILDGLLTEIRAEHTFVMVTHNIAKGLEWATDLMIIESGRIAYEHAAGVDHESFSAVYREHVNDGSVAMSGWAQFKAILRKDLIRELRTRDMIVSMILFVLLAMIIFHYAFTVKEGADLTYFTGGMLWVTFIFAMLLGLNRSFAQEKDERCLDGLLLCPVDRVTIFFAKTVGNLVFLLIIQAVAVPVFTLFFIERSYVADLLPFLVVLLLADLGICALGTLLATISMNTRSRDLLLPILFLPLIVPVLIAATGATTLIFAEGAGFGSLVARLLFLLGFDAVFLVAAWGTYDFAIGE